MVRHNDVSHLQQSALIHKIYLALI
ncbi:hypothetical protein AFERRI_30243 [Acidithiobacillus ferrivorans]|uniref:Uncharacterized protein n=1 Tax=Acidithiobacillus ferrivorans TaxID=160808 RepID=A0A060ULS6_9PROT|nr:hypothetical protein AFERRI_30243 [Acidithiobacillus ferrivorans]